MLMDYIHWFLCFRQLTNSEDSYIFGWMNMPTVADLDYINVSRPLLLIYIYNCHVHRITTHAVPWASDIFYFSIAPEQSIIFRIPFIALLQHISEIRTHMYATIYMMEAQIIGYTNLYIFFCRTKSPVGSDMPCNMLLMIYMVSLVCVLWCICWLCMAFTWPKGHINHLHKTHNACILQWMLVL